MSSVEKNTLPEGWKTVKLDEIGSFHRGINYKKPQLLEIYEEGCITLLRANNIQNGLYLDDFQYLPNGFVKDDKLTKSGDIFLAMSSGSKHLVGKNAVLPSLSNYTFGAFCSVYRLDQVEQSPFVSMFFQSHYYKKIISNLFRGAGINNLRSSDLDEVSIPIPPIEEQKRIVAKIDTLFAKIDKAISLTEESLKQANNLLPSVLNEVFEGFECDSNSYKLKDICELITDGSHFSPKTIDSGLPYVTVRDVSWGGEIDLINCARISVDDFEKLKKGNCAPKSGDILYSKDGTVGKIAIVDQEKEFVVLSSLAIIRPTKRLASTFLMYSMMSPKFYDFALSSKTGAAIKRIVLKTIKEFEIALPDIKTQLDTVNSLDEFSQYSKQTQSKLEEQLAYLKQLKSSILSKAFKGEL